MTDASCQEVQRRLHAEGLQAFAADEAARRHLLECPQCFAALQHMSAPGEPQPAPAERTAATTETAADDRDSALFQRRLRGRGGRLAPWLIAVAALALAAAGISSVLVARRHASRAPSTSPASTESESPEWLDDDYGEPDQEQGGRGRRHRDEEGQMASRTGNRFGLESAEQAEDPRMAREEAKEAAANAGILGILKAQVGSAQGARDGSRQPEPAEDDAWLFQGDVSGHGAGTLGLGTLGTIGGGHGSAGADKRAKAAAPKADAPVPALAATTKDDKRADPRPRQRATANPEGFAASMRLPNAWKPTSSAHSAPLDPPAPTTVASPPARAPASAAEALLARYSALEGVRFVDPNGYYENTYVPGDPSLRALQARLRAYDRVQLLPPAVRSARLDDASRRNAQPFDPPAHAALGVYMSASERGLTSARRMLLQVGLQATPRYSGRRPAMNIGLVLDAREPLDNAQSATVRALLAAFADARDLGDKLALFGAGPGGGELVAADAFRSGPLTVALQRIVAERSAPSVSLRDAVQRAQQTVRGSDDPNAPLGSSVVIVIAPRALGGELAELQALAHRGAVDGVPLSVFGVGAQAVPSELATLALAGQGNRRMLTSGGDAAAAVDRELSSVARVVARAVRLRVRLAPGTRLISVLGARRLDEAQSQRVRDAENSIDQRISRNLGIERDRGEDEEGVQIVIPSFYAGDSHTVLLDVVAGGPGPIADVTVRYKDLVQLGNGVTRESLWLPNLELARGALQRNVLKNLIAYELARYLDSAGDLLAGGQDGGHARAVVGQALALLESLGGAVVELAGDRELEADRALLSEYHALLGQIDRAPQREFAADSLHFASLLKLQPRPEWDARTE